jgi:Fur family ferric uptake transcriptional regulator
MRESIIKKLKDKGLKLTSQRLAIIEVLDNMTPIHPRAYLIYHEARKKGKRMSLSTVYATLKELSKHGIIRMLEFDKMGNRYEANTKEHINLICKGCNMITDYHSPFMIDTREILKKCRFWVTDSRVEYYGYCQKCVKTQTI